MPTMPSTALAGSPAERKASRIVSSSITSSCRATHRDGRTCHDPLLFPSKRGTSLHYQNFRRRHWNDAVAAAGLAAVTPHDLRHTYGSWLIQSKKVTLDGLQILFGHESRETTERYRHFAEGFWVMCGTSSTTTRRPATTGTRMSCGRRSRG